MSGLNYDRSKKNSILNPTVSYAFALQVEAAFMLPVKSVRVFNKENEFDYYQEGGLNDYVHMLRKPVSRPFTFQVERYVGVSASADFNLGFVDPLTLGTDLILPLVLYVNRSPAPDWDDNIDFKNCARAYIFTGCTVTAKEYGELNAEQSKLLTETTTIAYRELFTINQISPAWEKGGVWKYPKEGEPYTGATDGESHKGNRQEATTTTNLSSEDMKNKEKYSGYSLWTYPKASDSYKGGGDSRRKTTPYTENNLSKVDMQKKEKNSRAGKWSYPTLDEPYTGTGDSHEINRSDNLSKETMEDTKSLWNYPPEGAPYEGTGRSAEETSSHNTPKADMEARASKWEYMDVPYSGGGTPHDQNRSKNKSKAEMEGGASIYPPNRRAFMADALDS